MNWDDSITTIPNVTNLTISHKGITQLPSKIFKLTSLASLYCDNNKLTKLPKEISFLTSLSHLMCNHNELTELPKEIGSLKSLYVFYCHNNKLTKLPKEIASIKSLLVFYCYDNPFGNIQFPEYVNNLAQSKKYLKSSELIIIRAKRLAALLKIQSFISQKVIPKYFDTNKDICLYI